MSAHNTCICKAALLCESSDVGSGWRSEEILFHKTCMCICACWPGENLGAAVTVDDDSVAVADDEEGGSPAVADSARAAAHQEPT